MKKQSIFSNQSITLTQFARIYLIQIFTVNLKILCVKSIIMKNAANLGKAATPLCQRNFAPELARPKIVLHVLHIS